MGGEGYSKRVRWSLQGKTDVHVELGEDVVYSPRMRHGEDPHRISKLPILPETRYSSGVSYHSMEHHVLDRSRHQEFRFLPWASIDGGHESVVSRVLLSSEGGVPKGERERETRQSVKRELAKR